MKDNRLLAAGVLLAVCLSVASLWTQTKKSSTPFDSYRQNPASELSVRETKFDVAALYGTMQPENGLTAPQIEGFTEDGKLLIQVQVYSSQMPQTVDARKEAMLTAVGNAKLGYSAAFGSAEVIRSFDKWTRLTFFDVDTLLKSTTKKPLDPVIGVYENGGLVLR